MNIIKDIKILLTRLRFICMTLQDAFLHIERSLFGIFKCLQVIRAFFHLSSMPHKTAPFADNSHTIVEHEVDKYNVIKIISLDTTQLKRGHQGMCKM